MKKDRQTTVGAGSPQPTADSSARRGRADESAVGYDKSAPTLDLCRLILTPIGRSLAVALVKGLLK